MSILEQLDEILLPDTTIREVDESIYSALDPDEGVNSYDEGGALALYDAVACNPLYNRLIWGYWPSTLHEFCAGQLDRAGEGWFLDAGCGSAAFTARAYRNAGNRMILADQSINLLRKARERLAGTGRLDRSIVLLQADILRLPFKESVFSSTLCMNMLHVLDDVGGVVRELQRTLAPGGSLGFTTLLLADRWADSYLRMWERKGEVVGRRADDLKTVFAERELNAAISLGGNMAYVEIRN